MTETLENRRKRLVYRAMHRGIKEADIVIGGFAVRHLDELSVAELDESEALIAFPDKELYEWITGKVAPPANLIGPVFERLQKFDAANAVKEMTAI